MAIFKFPNNYRIFPEIIKNIGDELIILAGLFCLLISILLIQTDLYENLKHKQRLDNEKTKVYKDLSFWEQQIQEKPDYRDAYLNLAIINFQIGKLDEARANLARAFEIDPNYERRAKFEAVLK